MREYRKMTATERAELDGFYGGVSVALHAGLFGESATGAQYREVMGSLGEHGVHEFYLWARRNGDVELPRIREYLRGERRRKALRSARPVVENAGETR